MSDILLWLEDIEDKNMDLASNDAVMSVLFR